MLPKASPPVDLKVVTHGAIKSVIWQSIATPVLGPTPFTEQDFHAALERAARSTKSALAS